MHGVKKRVPLLIRLVERFLQFLAENFNLIAKPTTTEPPKHPLKLTIEGPPRIASRAAEHSPKIPHKLLMILQGVS